MPTTVAGNKWTALTGIVAGAVAVGVSQLGAAAVGPNAAPVVAVGDAVVDLVPPSVKNGAIEVLGTMDKPALLTGIVVLLALAAAGIGMLAARRWAFGAAGMAVFGVIGMAAAVTRPEAGALNAVPTLVGAVVGLYVLHYLVRLTTPATPATPAAAAPAPSPTAVPARRPVVRQPETVPPGAHGEPDVTESPEPLESPESPDAQESSVTETETETEPEDGPEADAVSAARVVTEADAASEEGVVSAEVDAADGAGPEATDPVGAPGMGGGSGFGQIPEIPYGRPPGEPVNRRKLIQGLAIGAGVATVTFAGGELLGRGPDVTAARTSLKLPRAARPLPPLPSGTDLRVRGLAPFVTPNKDFYRVDTALIVPHVSPADWTLRIHGMVDRPVEITFDQLIRRPLREADVTLTCVSNEVGGPYIGNARWLGAYLPDILREAGIQSGADMLLSTSQDGWTAGTPVDVVMDGRQALLAVAMNGTSLPVEHGFPVRQVIPGLYGYVSATKWIVDIKVTRFAADVAYWTDRGWSAKGPIKTESRIDVPSDGANVTAGKVTVAGVAWAQHRGIQRVDLRVDGGAWQPARLATVPGPDTWRQWSAKLDLPKGSHRVEVRATDGTGEPQSALPLPPAPNGASGFHTVQVTAS